MIAVAPAGCAGAPISTVSGARAPVQETLVLYFEPGEVAIRGQNEVLLDRAARIFRDDQPTAFVISGATDAVGAPEANLLISERRASAVLRGLRARGIPITNFRLLALGATDPAVPAAEGVPEARNRRVEIRWR